MKNKLIGTQNMLGIVIPYYKRKYFEEVLTSFVEQTDPHFTIYIADDASPESITDLLKKYDDKLNINYTRFEKNLGGLDLVKHWNRSIELCDKPWIWLFSDDDIPGKNCVKSFYEAVLNDKNEFDVFRFNTLLIDEHSKQLSISPPLPITESSLEFLYHRIKGQRHNCGVNHIFSKKCFEKEGGMINFPVAWYSDDASWIAFAGNKGFFTVQGSYVKWRISPEGLSAKNNKTSMKIEALIDYLDWIKIRFKDSSIDELGLNFDTISQLSKGWFVNNLIYAGFWCSPSKILLFSKRLGHFYQNQTWQNLVLFFKAFFKKMLMSFYKKIF